MDKEPSININLGNSNFEMNRENSFLYTFIGRAALNHIFIKRDDLPQPEDGNITATYLFRDLMPNKDVFDRIASLMQDKEFPQFLNQKDIPQCDVDAYMRTATQDLSGDTIPEGWE